MVKSQQWGREQSRVVESSCTCLSVIIEIISLTRKLCKSGMGKGEVPIGGTAMKGMED
jgi:hypothetical protein